MPSIKITERELISTGALNVTTNAVYIPGYAIMGPINEPILCESVEEFKEIFGSTPYVFRNAQPWPGSFGDYAKTDNMGNFYNIGDYEKSYIMALELLQLGTPVLFERKFDTVKLNDHTASLTSPPAGFAYIKAVFPGKKYTDVKVKIYNDTTTKICSLTVTDINGKDHITRFTLQDNIQGAFKVGSGSIFKDISGLVEVSINSSTSLNSLPMPTQLTYSGANNDEIMVDDMYDMLEDTFDKLKDRGDYNIKFITSGAYPTLEYKSESITSKMLTVAESRGDCAALIDHTPNNERVLSSTGSLIEYVREDNTFKSLTTKLIYGALFTPYGVYNCNASVSKQVILPASFGYLSALSLSTQTNSNWVATAGVARGVVPNLVSLCQPITNAVADSYQTEDTISINPITNIRPYGLRIWGNRTLKDNSATQELTPTSFLNIRNLTSDIKKVVWAAAKALTFEQNSDILWINFKSKVTPLLDQMITSNGLSRYDIKRKATSKRATLKAIIRLYAVEAVEDWDITLELADNSAVITE